MARNCLRLAKNFSIRKTRCADMAVRSGRRLALRGMTAACQTALADSLSRTYTGARRFAPRDNLEQMQRTVSHTADDALSHLPALADQPVCVCRRTIIPTACRQQSVRC